jgi:hypothetical protein
MREIDPQSDGPMENDQLRQALRQLASSSRQGAPAAVGMGLATSFRRHHRRRKLVRRISVAAFVACIAIAAGLLSIRSPHQQPQKQQTHEVSGKVAEKPAKAASVAGTPARPSAKRVTPKAAPLVASSVRREFLALPGYDPGVPADELSVVRVQLPASALWQMGAPVSPDSGARKFMADFVVAQDGTPYAVRLVQ